MHSTLWSLGSVARSKIPEHHGLVVVDKPTGLTSHDVVARARKLFGQRQVGHAGTLDPDATGVLLLGLGRATRLLRYLSESRKAYRGTVVFGTATSTLDAAGTVTDSCDMIVDQEIVERAAARFVGDIEQIPPMVSAIKIGGRRLHELAREGIEVERAPRPVTIHALVVESLVDGVATIRVECSSGTYIRTVAADLGIALGGYAHLGTLRRLSVGSFTIAEAVTLETIADNPSAVVLSPAVAVRTMPRVVVDADVAAAVAHGAMFVEHELLDVDTAARPGPFAVLDTAGALLAVYEKHGSGNVKPAVVLNAAGGS